jgi:hypothetical protein
VPCAAIDSDGEQGAAVDRRTFTDVTSQWWLSGDLPETSDVEMRKDIGGGLGCGREYAWFRDETELNKLYTLLEGSPTELWRTIDQATDYTSQIDWLKEVAEFVDLQTKRGGAVPDDEHAEHAQGSATEEPVSVERPTPAPAAQEKSSPFNSMISAELQPTVNDLADVVATVVAEVPGAEDLTPQELAELVAEVLAEQ